VAPPAPSAQALRQAAVQLAGADRPIILAGNGAQAPRARTLIRELAAALRIPVVTTPMGKGVLDETDDLCLGPTGRNGTYAANQAARTADVILALGTRFDDRASSSWIPGVTFAIPVWVVWKNTGYGSIRGQQATFFSAGREIATRP
jgi:acetolactate synthase I/II/III large subunit